VFTSKKQNIPFDIILGKSIDGIFFINNSNYKKEILDSSIGNDVKNIILDIKKIVTLRAKKIYPYLRSKL
jgi:ssDNA-specific exonuclease RecJ